MPTLVFKHEVTELWTLDQSPAFINGFLAAALQWIEDQEEEDYYFVVEHDNMMIPVTTDYAHYEDTRNVTFYASFRPRELLTTLLQRETSPGHYGILVSTSNDQDRHYVMGLQSPSLDFIQGLLSAIDTFDLQYVLRYMIYRDGTYYNIPGRNLIMPTE